MSRAMTSVPQGREEAREKIRRRRHSPAVRAPLRMSAGKVALGRGVDSRGSRREDRVACQGEILEEGRSSMDSLPRSAGRYIYETLSRVSIVYDSYRVTYHSICTSLL